MSENVIMTIAFCPVGAVLVAIAAAVFIRTRIFMSIAQEVKGTVIQMVYRGSSSSSSGGGYSPVYQFKTKDGKAIVVTDNLSSNPPAFKEGQVIDVLYDPANPQKASIKRWMSLYLVPLLLGGLGVIFGGVGVALLISLGA